MINLRRIRGRLMIGVWTGVAITGAVVFATDQGGRLTPSLAQTQDVAPAARPLVQHEVHRLAVEDRELAEDEETDGERTESEPGWLVHPLSEYRGPTNMTPAEPRALGDDEVLDRLWLECEEGSGAACDVLFEQAPVGSDYESFGLSCGDRPGVLNCTIELDEPEPLNSYGQAIRPPIASDD